MAMHTMPKKLRQPATGAKRFKRATSPSVVVELANQQRRHAVRRKVICDAVRAIVAGERCKSANVSVVIIDDETIHKMNREFLEHDEPTDVLSFLFESDQGRVDGEIVVSADTAAKAAGRFGWTFADELLLYVIHGTLHLFGYDDRTTVQRRKMRTRERYYLKQFGLAPHYAEGKRS
jgi:probable rRNA maturation factor